MKAVKDWTKTKKEKASYLRMENRKMMVKWAFEKRMKAVKDKMNAKKEKATKRKEKRNMMAIKAIEWYNYDPKYRFLYDRISDLFAELLKADLEHSNTGRTEKIRINESHYVYRVRNRLQKEVLVPLRKALELPEIYMSANQWNLLQCDRISSVALKTYKWAFYKHDRERFLHYLQNVQCSELPKTTANNLLPHEILNLLQYVNGLEVAERQWKRMLDAFSKNGKFVNCISTFNMNDCTHGFCCGFTLMTSELCANPWKGKLLRYGDNPEIVSIEVDDFGSRINFCRLNNVVSPKGDDSDTKQWSLRLLPFLDKILETAIDLNVSKQDMIKRVFVFDGTGLAFREILQYEGCCSSCLWLDQ
ncbi:uncharacterized protein LOC115981230 [Quercus lobata]|uniref:uncharacterized protein LOC115981230 n=1 Tax=Quercus lobata TaxID=97700 RepID=UPI0012455383|nr:uncharacterized protein LOC115981230 [Quercus lobata]